MSIPRDKCPYCGSDGIETRVSYTGDTIDNDLNPAMEVEYKCYCSACKGAWREVVSSTLIIDTET